MYRALASVLSWHDGLSHDSFTQHCVLMVQSRVLGRYLCTGEYYGIGEVGEVGRYLC